MELVAGVVLGVLAVSMCLFAMGMVLSGSVPVVLAVVPLAIAAGSMKMSWDLLKHPTR